MHDCKEAPTDSNFPSEKKQNVHVLCCVETLSINRNFVSMCILMESLFVNRNVLEFT